MEDKIKRKITYIGKDKLTDNDFSFLSEIVTIVYYSDPQAEVLINGTENKTIIHITPSQEDFRSSIITNLLYLNNHSPFKIRFSSSLKLSKKISFHISH